MKFAICNELFEGWDFADFCKTVHELGYTGIEIAPFTLAPTVDEIDLRRRQEIRRIAADQGLEIVALHWLFAKTEGFSFTSPDAEVRERTAKHLVRLGGLGHDIGTDVLVLGSPSVRTLPSGVSREDAESSFVDTVLRAHDELYGLQQVLALEPLGPAETDFMNTADEAEAIRRRIASPIVQLHLDVKAMSTEPTPIPDIIRKHAYQMAHFHANDPNKRGPGMGEVRFKPIFQSLKEVGYQGWVSVEVFDFMPDAVMIARESIDYMRRVWDSIA